ncbi:MAG: hypothetical protein RBQ91_07675 [Acholeplasma sp.]|nr:hypothetical protein [Acholeplasma sp.]
MITVGKRSSGQFSIYTVLYVGLVGLLVFGSQTASIRSNPEQSRWIYLCIGTFTVIYLIYVSSYFSIPKALIKMDEKNLYLHHRSHQDIIPLIDIIGVNARKTRSRNMTYTFGKLFIETTSKTYFVSSLANCEAVSSDISKRLFDARSSNQTSI